MNLNQLVFAMNRPLKRAVITAAIACGLGAWIYFYSYSWSRSITRNAPSSWILVYEQKGRWLNQPWSIIAPVTDGIWYIKEPPDLFDPVLAGGQKIALMETVSFVRSSNGVERSDNWEVVSLDRGALDILNRQQLDQLFFGDINAIDFDWYVFSGENAGSATVAYCIDHQAEFDIIREGL